jgi:holo-[acyl-carrier protein] synthase
MSDNPTTVDRERKLRELVARFWRLELADVNERLVFDAAHVKNMSSTRFLTFLAGLESQLGVHITDPGTVTSYAALCRAVVGGSAPPSTSVTEREAVPTARPAHGPSFGLGQDIEELELLPVATDWAAHPFYARNFTPKEIAWCAAQAEPRRHFAARLCAKEALKKAHPLLTPLTLASIEVSSDADGRPSLSVLDDATLRRLGPVQILVSLSHTDRLASAVVLLVG